MWWYNIDSLLKGGLTWSIDGYGSPAEKPDVTTSAPPIKATIRATPYKAPKPINPLISAMNQNASHPNSLFQWLKRPSKHFEGLFHRIRKYKNIFLNDNSITICYN